MFGNYERHVFALGTLIRHNPSCVKAIVEKIGLQDAKIATTPQLESLNPLVKDKFDPLDEEKKMIYRSCVSTLVRAISGREDAQNAIHELAADLIEPSKKSYERLKRLVNYLKDKAITDEGHWFENLNEDDTREIKLKASTRSNWMQWKRNRKSTGSEAPQMKSVLQPSRIVILPLGAFAATRARPAPWPAA